MGSQVLFLFDGLAPDESVWQLLSTRELALQNSNTLASAMNLIHTSRSQIESQKSFDSVNAFNLIVADVAAGGISLAEYAIEQYASVGLRPVIVLLDSTSDINAARRAIRLGVDVYLLPSDSAEFRSQSIEQAIQQMDTIGATKSVLGTSLPPLSGSNGSTKSNFQQPVARLSTIESAIIDCLSNNPGLPVSARTIVNTVMGRDLDEDKAASLLRPHISRLRSKLEPLPQMPQHLLTVRGKGYMVV
jgi:two-component system response regulator RegX3